MEVSVAPNLDQLAPLAEAVEEFVDLRGLPPALAFQFNLALDELVTNIVTHAGAIDPISIELLHDAGRLTGIVRDRGPAFDPFQRDDPDTGLSVEDREIGGLGIFFVKKVMDEVHYERVADRNEVRFSKNVPAAAESD